MSLSGTVPIDANGTATLVLKNDSPVKGFRIDALTVRVESDTLAGLCTVYRGNQGSVILAQSGVGRFDQANGPYWLGPGGFITLVWTGQTPGLLAYADLTGIQVPNQDTFQQGVLRFENPPISDIIARSLPGEPVTLFGETDTSTNILGPTTLSQYWIIESVYAEYLSGSGGVDWSINILDFLLGNEHVLAYHRYGIVGEVIYVNRPIILKTGPTTLSGMGLTLSVNPPVSGHIIRWSLSGYFGIV